MVIIQFVEETDGAHKSRIITAFMSAVQNDLVAGELDFLTLHEPEYMQYWAHLVIVEYRENTDDFRYVYFGTKVVRNYGLDLTGKQSGEIPAGYFPPEGLKTLRLDVIKNKRLAYGRGSIITASDNLEKNVSAGIVPLRKGGKGNFCVTCFDYDP